MECFMARQAQRDGAVGKVILAVSPPVEVK